MGVRTTIRQSFRDFRGRILGASYEDTILAYLAVAMGAYFKNAIQNWQDSETVWFDLTVLGVLVLAYIALTLMAVLRDYLKKLVVHKEEKNALEIELMRLGIKAKDGKIGG